MDPIVEEVVEEPQETLRDTIEKAVDETEGSDVAAKPAPEPVAKSPEQQTKPAGSPGTERVAKPKPEGARPGAPAGTAAAPAGDGAKELRAPNQWKPAVREHWNKLPREVQEEVLRREGDAMRLIGNVRPKVQLADEVTGHIAPFNERLQANGASPSEFMNDVFSTVKGLAAGSPQDKAEIIANIVQSYGVDLRMLDAVLTHRISGPPPDPRVLEAQRRAQQAEAQVARYRGVQDAQTSKSAAQTLEQFAAKPENEFFDDVRDMMADLIETGRATNLEDAYSASIWANPDTRKILLAREAGQRASQRGQRAAVARNASSSVHGTPRHAGNAPTQGSMSLRDTIASAFDSQDSA